MNYQHSRSRSWSPKRSGWQRGVSITNHEPIFVQITNHVCFLKHFTNHVFNEHHCKNIIPNWLITCFAFGFQYTDSFLAELRVWKKGLKRIKWAKRTLSSTKSVLKVSFKKRKRSVSPELNVVDILVYWTVLTFIGRTTMLYLTTSFVSPSLLGCSLNSEFLSIRFGNSRFHASWIRKE